MERKEKPIQPPDAILKNAIKQIKKLDAVTMTKPDLTEAKKYNDAQFKKGKIVAGLPDMIRTSIQSGFSFPEDELGHLEFWANQAREFLEERNSFKLAVFLQPWGFRPGDLNQIELVVKRVYPPKRK